MRQGSWRFGVMVVALLLVQGCSSQLTQKPPMESGTPTAVPAASAGIAPLSQDEMLALLGSNRFAELDRHFSTVQTAYEQGQLDDEGLRAAFRVFYATDERLEPQYDAWVTRFPKSYVARLARGIYFKKVAEDKRGGDYIGKTKPEQIAAMEAYFAKAASDFSGSVALTRKPLLTYLHSMDVAAYQGRDEETDKLLQLAVEVDPNNFIVRDKYMAFLRPRWGGSVEQMHDFLNDCRKAGLPARQLRLLEAVIVEDEAHAYKEEGNYSAAESAYRKAIEMGLEECLGCFAEVLTQENKFADVIPVYSKMLLAQPKDAATLASRGFAYQRTGDMHAAITDWAASANLGNTYAQNQMGIANMMGLPGVVPVNPAAGIDWFRKAAAQGDPDGIRNLDSALKLNPAAAKSPSTVSALHN